MKKQAVDSIFAKWTLGLILLIGLLSTTGFAFRNVTYQNTSAKTELLAKPRADYKTISFRKIVIDRNKAIFTQQQIRIVTSQLERNLGTLTHLNHQNKLHILGSNVNTIQFIRHSALPAQEGTYFTYQG